MKRLLIVGGSSEIGKCLLELLSQQEWKIGAHCFRGGDDLKFFLQTKLRDSKSLIKVYQANLSHQENCHKLVDEYILWAGGIDYFVQLSGDITKKERWINLDESSWLADLAINLNSPFFLTQRVFSFMKNQKSGGRIVLMSTASVLTGGGLDSMGYGVAKAGIQCLVKGIAKEGATSKILINALAPGFISTNFHTKRAKKSPAEIIKRSLKIPIGRSGNPNEIAQAIFFLLGDASGFMTGQTLNISGGEWI